MYEKLFELFCIKNDFAKCFTESSNLFKYCFTHYGNSSDKSNLLVLYNFKKALLAPK